MTPAARLQATIQALEEVRSTPRPADAVISGFFRARRFIGSKDRANIATVAYDILRCQARLDWWLAKAQAEPLPRARVLAFCALVDGQSQESLALLFSGKAYAPPALQEEEKRWIRKLCGHTLDHPGMDEATRVECPAWAEPSLRQRFGKAFSREMAALLEPAPLDLRVNALKMTRQEAIAELVKQGVKAKACALSPLGVRIEDRPALSRLALLKNGGVEIQDEGSQLVATLVDARPGERVVDFCAGAGGKTLAMAAQMQNKGRIVACDVLAARLKRSAERFRRAGAHNIDIKPLTSERDPWVKRHKGTFDRVLVDAPCSGSGTWRRNPDQRWRSLGPGLETLIPLQASILDSAARLTKPGGRLVYATCSLFAQENEDQVNAFLSTHDDFALVPICQADPELAARAKLDAFLSLTPSRHGTDGFFAAVLARQPSQEKATFD